VLCCFVVSVDCFGPQTNRFLLLSVFLIVLSEEFMFSREELIVCFAGFVWDPFLYFLRTLCVFVNALEA